MTPNKYMRQNFTQVSHTTLNPEGPGVVRIHLIPPKIKKEIRSDPKFTKTEVPQKKANLRYIFYLSKRPTADTWSPRTVATL